MRFKIEHHTDNEKEYEEIMEVIKHWEIVDSGRKIKEGIEK